MFSILILILIVAAVGVSSTVMVKRANAASGFFSVVSMVQKLLLLVKRFPISILFVVGLAVLFFVAVNGDFDDISYQLWIFFSIGAFISITATLSAEDHFNNLKTCVVTLFAVLFWGVYCFFLPEKSDDIQISKGIEIFVIGGAAFSAMLFISFPKKNKDRAFWNFTVQTLSQMALACIFGAILFGGLSLALVAIDNLFNVSIDGKIYGNLAVICFALFTPIYFLANIPDKTEKHNDEILYTKIQKILALYILTPILTVYAVILYAYLFKIVVAWELPNGWVSWLVSALALGGLLVIAILYPVREQEKNKVITFISRWFGLLILPLLVLMTVGIFRRIGDYGITINRGYILLLNLWFYGIYIYIFSTQLRHIKWILISFVTVALISSVGFWSVSNITKKSLTKEVSTVLNQQVSAEEARAIFAAMTQKENSRMRSTLDYLYIKFGKESIQPFFVDTIPSNYLHFLSYLGLKEIEEVKDVLDEERKKILYDASGAKTWQIDEGYNTFAPIHYYDYDKRSKLDDSSKKEKIRVEVSVDNRTFPIPIRQIVLEYLAMEEKLQYEKNWTVRGDGYTIIISSFNGDYYPQKDSVSINRIEGYLFYK